MSWTNNKLSVFCAALSALLCNAASANIEPSSYDAKSIAAGTTGMAYLDSPSALAINPANLAGIDRGHPVLDHRRGSGAERPVHAEAALIP